LQNQCYVSNNSLATFHEDSPPCQQNVDWMFGLSFDATGMTNPLGNTLIRLAVFMRTVQVCINVSAICPFLPFPLLQIIYLTIGLFVFALVSTFVARRRPHGPQPAAYGHLQTLANLVDEWSPTMWWGHKENGKPICHAGVLFQPLLYNTVQLISLHAGTCNLPLPPVRMNTWYAGTHTIHCI
jgi:hypothetical protein